MKIIQNIKKNDGIIKKSIREYGYAAEHNYHHYLNSETAHDKNIFFNFKGNGILTQLYRDKEWYMLSEVLAPEHQRLKFFFKFIDYALSNKKHRKVVVEVTKDFRKQIIDNIDNSKYKICSLNYSLDWPVFQMKKWDCKLKGKNFKKLRNIKNRFYRLYNIKTVDSKKIEKRKLKKIVDGWIKNRKAEDEVEQEEYYNMIDNGFKGFDVARTIIINKKPCTITAGWNIPNSKNYYSAIGIFNYQHPGIGELANIDDLITLKKKKYEFVDFGGSDKVLFNFKKKFGPHGSYKTYIFSIIRNEVKSSKNIKIPKDLKIAKVRASQWPKIDKEIYNIEKRCFPPDRRFSTHLLSLTFLSKDSINLILKRKNKLIGYIASRKTRKNVINLESIAVLNEFRGKKIGKHFFRNFIKQSKKEGYSKITLRATSKAMINLARSEGFKKLKKTGKDIYMYRMI